MRLIAFIEGWPKTVSIFVGALLIAVIGVLDFLTGYELTFSAFYLLPIFILAWLSGQWGGLGGAIASAAVRTVVDVLGGQPYAHPVYAVWNMGMRLAVFAVVALLIAILRKNVDHERALARVDNLTGAANTRAFLEMLNSEVERSRRYSRTFTVAYFDLDNFKSVNDSFGHAKGDELLQLVVSIVRSHVRLSDVIARLGGDEFALLLPETDQTAARSAITKIQSHILQAMQAGKWPVTVSIGALTHSGGVEDVEELIRKADNLMYAAKLKGKNSVQYSG
jgi:diguanylate cyclase (GGDEF)-like protein